MSRKSKKKKKLVVRKEPKRMVAMGFDFDGSVGDMLTSEVERSMESLKNVDDGVLGETRTQLLKRIDEIAAGAQRKVLWNFSARQSHEVDKYNAIAKDGASVFATYEDFVASRADWELRKTLIADHQQGVASGTEWDNADSKWEQPYCGGRCKVETAQMIIDDAVSQASTDVDHIDVYLLDDVRTYLKDVLNYVVITDKRVTLVALQYEWWHTFECGLTVRLALYVSTLNHLFTR